MITDIPFKDFIDKNFTYILKLKNIYTLKQEK